VEGLRNAESETEATQDDKPDIKGEDNAIEMTDNFDAKLHDMEPDGKQFSCNPVTCICRNVTVVCIS